MDLTSLVWVDKRLKQAIKKVFEPRYRRQLKEDEVLMIAESLTNLMESYLRYKWRLTYGINSK